MKPAGDDSVEPRCRSCGTGDLLDVLDLGPQPPAGSFPGPGEEDEPAAPLHSMVCRACWLLQLVGLVPAEPPATRLQPTVSTTMAAHAEGFVDEVLGRSGADALVVEVASHGGHLQSRFAARGVQTLVVEPSEALVTDSRAAGGAALASPIDGQVAALIGTTRDAMMVDNYLLAHLPDPNAEMAMIRGLIGETGVAALEFDHALPILVDGQFDALRHGHYSYLTLSSLLPLLERHGLRALEAATHSVYGGALRVWVGAATSDAGDGSGVDVVLREEATAGVQDPALYTRFAERAEASRRGLRAFLEDARSAGRRVAAYGAPSRGNALLNACGITPALLPYTADASSGKQGRRMAGSGIPIVAPEQLVADRPDDVLILTWDIADEVISQLPEVHAWGGRFVLPIPAISFR